MMQIEITKEEYHKLLEIVYITDWILNSYSLDHDNDKFITEFSSLQQALFAKADEFGCQDYIQLDPKNGQFFSTTAFDELMEGKDGVFRYIDQFEEHLFWESLTERLARRDIETKLGCEEFNKKSPFERYSLLEKMMNKYHQEFQKSGLQNFKIVDQD